MYSTNCSLSEYHTRPACLGSLAPAPAPGPGRGPAEADYNAEQTLILTKDDDDVVLVPLALHITLLRI